MSEIQGGKGRAVIDKGKPSGIAVGLNSATLPDEAVPIFPYLPAVFTVFIGDSQRFSERISGRSPACITDSFNCKKKVSCGGPGGFDLCPGP